MAGLSTCTRIKWYKVISISYIDTVLVLIVLVLVEVVKRVKRVSSVKNTRDRSTGTAVLVGIVRTVINFGI